MLLFGVLASELGGFSKLDVDEVLSPVKLADIYFFFFFLVTASFSNNQ